jgi:hypothetical protein
MAKFLTSFAVSKGIILLLVTGHWTTVKYFSSNIKLRAGLRWWTQIISHNFKGFSVRETSRAISQPLKEKDGLNHYSSCYWKIMLN